MHTYLFRKNNLDFFLRNSYKQVSFHILNLTFYSFRVQNSFLFQLPTHLLQYLCLSQGANLPLLISFLLAFGHVCEELKCIQGTWSKSCLVDSTGRDTVLPDCKASGTQALGNPGVLSRDFSAFVYGLFFTYLPINWLHYSLFSILSGSFWICLDCTPTCCTSRHCDNLYHDSPFYFCLNSHRSQILTFYSNFLSQLIWHGPGSYSTNNQPPL